MKKYQEPENDNQPIRGHVYHCDQCGDEGVCCDTSNGGIVIDCMETQLALGERVPLLAGDSRGRRTGEWLCETCAGDGEDVDD